MKTSINIKYDTNDSALITDYYATNSHSEIINGVLSAITSSNHIRSHIAYGPYGSGKSYVASILVSLLNKKFSAAQIKDITRKYEKIDTRIPGLIRQVKSSKTRYIPVLLTGYEGDFSAALLKALDKALKKTRYKIIYPGTHQMIIDTITRWEREFPNTYYLFEQELSYRDIQLSDFHHRLIDRDNDTIMIFAELHAKLTAGAELNTFGDENFIDVVEDVCAQLKSKNAGLFFVYDEFGRVLQQISPQDNNHFMQILQDFAELANNGVDNLTTLFITHKPISYYFAFNSKELRTEFSKVEKRFSVYEINSDYTTFLHITRGYISSLGINQVSPDTTLISNAFKYNPFNNMFTDTVLENAIIRELYPLHPISTYLLPKVSSVFGQNERTLFSFLTDTTSLGLSSSIKESKVYYPDFLVDYFLNGIDETYVEDIREYGIFKKNIKRMDALIEESQFLVAARIYKFVLIWKIASGASGIKLTSDFIAFALGLEKEIVVPILITLAEQKMARFNVIQDQWELFEGSAIDLDKEINIRAADYPLTHDEFVRMLDEQNPYRYLYPNEYNAEHEITRFASVQFCTPEIESRFTINDQSDFSVLVSVGELKKDYQPDKIIRLKAIEKNVWKSMQKMKVIHLMIDDHPFMNTHPNVDVELEYELSSIKKTLNQFYQSVLFSKWKTTRIWSEKLSDLISSKYPYTFHIVNDQVNMYQLTKIQQKAINTVLDQYLQYYGNDIEKEFLGTKPADLVYFSVIEGLGSSKNVEVYFKLTQALSEYLNEFPQGSLVDLIDIAIKPPFGLRPRIAVLIVIKTIIEQWKDMLLFNQGNFIPNIDAVFLMDSVIQRTSIRYVFSRFDNVNRDFLEGISEIFGTDDDYMKGKTLSVRVCSNMYKWYMNLPIITQQTQDMTMSEVAFLNIIAKARINPQESIDELISVFGDLDFIKALKNNVEDHFDRYKTKSINKIFQRLGIDNPKKWAALQDGIFKKHNKLVKTIVQNEDLFEAYSSDIENIDVTRWTLSSYIAFQRRIEQDFKAMAKNRDFQTVIINGIEKHVEDVELAQKADNTLRNIVSTIEATKRYYSDQELEMIILQLIDKYIK